MQNTEIQSGDIVAEMQTSLGTIRIKLFKDQAPKTVANFVGLSKKGYYTGTIFHRVIKNFMIQWGDPTGTGMGGESIYGSEFEDEFHDDLTHIKWALSMANAGPGTNGSQFFIVQAPETKYLDGAHTVFGQVVEWIEIVDAIAKVQTNRNDKPLEDISILSIAIKE